MLGFSALVVCADADNHTNSGSDKATISFNTDFLFLTSKTARIVNPSGQLAILLVRFSSWALPSAIRTALRKNSKENLAPLLGCRIRNLINVARFSKPVHPIKSHLHPGRLRTLPAIHCHYVRFQNRTEGE